MQVTSSTFTRCLHGFVWLFAGTLSFVTPSLVAADDLVLSKSDNINNMLGGLTFLDGDVISYCGDTNGASLLFAESNISPSADIDAFTILDNGNYLLSVLFNGRMLGGLTFDDGDLVEYNPTTGVASIFFLTEADFTGATTNAGDINAVDFVDDRFIVFSLTASSTIFRGVDYSDGDLIQYNVNDGVVNLLVNEATLCDDGDCDIDAVHVLPNGNYVMSTFFDEVISGQFFLNGDLFEYNPVTDTATLFFSESNFTDTNLHNIDAVYVPTEPLGDNLGDMNCDGTVNLNDVAPFVQALLDPTGYDVAFPDCDITRADTDGSGGNDGADIAGLIERLL